MDENTDKTIREYCLRVYSGDEDRSEAAFFRIGRMTAWDALDYMINVCTIANRMSWLDVAVTVEHVDVSHPAFEGLKPEHIANFINEAFPKPPKKNPLSRLLG